MLKYLICGAVGLGAFASMGTAHATGVIVNGQHYSGGNVTVPYGHGTQNAANSGYCCGNIQLEDTGVVVSESTTYETVPMQPATEHELIYLDQPQPATYTETVTYAEPVMAAPIIAAPVVAHPPMRKHHAGGWGGKVYVGARGGWTSARDTDFGIAGLSVNNEYSNKGYNISGVAGWRGRVNRNIGYRLEAELGYMTAEVDRQNRIGGSDASGDTDVLFGFVNAYADIPLASRFSAIVGGGVGAGRVKFDDHGTSGDGTLLDDSDTAFGYNLAAGLSYDVNDHLALEAMYRYMSFINADLKSRDGVKSDIDVDSHNITVGARYGF